MENSPIVGTLGYSLSKSDVRMSGSKTKGNWEMGDYFGTWSTKGSSSDLLIKTVSSSETTFTINGIGFTQPLSAKCIGRSHKSNWAFYKLEPNDLKYVCEFNDSTTNFEVVLQDRDTVVGALMNSRIGRVRHNGVELSFEEQVIEGRKYSATSSVGYVLETSNKEVAGLDYRDESNNFSAVSVPRNSFIIFLPPKNDPNHKTAVIGTIALALFDDPKRRTECDIDGHTSDNNTDLC